MNTSSVFRHKFVSQNRTGPVVYKPDRFQCYKALIKGHPNLSPLVSNGGRMVLIDTMGSQMVSFYTIGGGIKRSRSRSQCDQICKHLINHSPKHLQFCSNWVTLKLRSCKINCWWSSLQCDRICKHLINHSSKHLQYCLYWVTPKG